MSVAPETERLGYDYEPSPGDGWGSTAHEAELWVRRWVETTSSWRVQRVVGIEQRGGRWHVEVDAYLCGCDVCRRTSAPPSAPRHWTDESSIWPSDVPFERETP
jgi:hypothetical protein